MLFDEYYQEKFYRNKSVEEALINADTLVLVGTAFYTALAGKIVRHALLKGLNIIEINQESQMGRLQRLNQICTIEGNAETILPSLVA